MQFEHEVNELIQIVRTVRSPVELSRAISSQICKVITTISDHAAAVTEEIGACGGITDSEEVCVQLVESLLILADSGASSHPNEPSISAWHEALHGPIIANVVCKITQRRDNIDYICKAVWPPSDQKTNFLWQSMQPLKLLVSWFTLDQTIKPTWSLLSCILGHISYPSHINDDKLFEEQMIETDS